MKKDYLKEDERSLVIIKHYRHNFQEKEPTEAILEVVVDNQEVTMAEIVETKKRLI